MADNFSQSVVRLVVAQICKNVGWDSINSSALEVLVDFVERHIANIGRGSRRYAEQFGRVDPTVDDIEMVFNDSGIMLKEILEYTKNVEPIALAQPVPEFPAASQSKSELFIPEIDEDGKVNMTNAVSSVVPAADSLSGSQNATGSIFDSPMAGSRLNTSPIRASPSKTCRLMGDIDNTRFRTRTQLMLEDGELSSLFSQGKGPAAGRPPKPLNEVNIPKLVTKAIAKPQIKTGVLKPTKQKHIQLIEEPAPSPTPTPEPEPEPVPSPLPVLNKPDRHKPPKKVERKKKKKKPTSAQPEGFSDIFGDPLEPPVKITKSKPTKQPKLEKQLSVTLEKLEPDLISPTPSSKQEVMSESDVSAMSDRNVTPDMEVDENNPDVRARLSNWDDTINSVLAGTKTKKSKTTEERPVTPKHRQKSPGASKKLKSPSRSDRSRSPANRSPSKKTAHQFDDIIDSVVKGAGDKSHTPSDRVSASPAHSTEVSPQPPADTAKPKHKKEKDKEKKKKRSRREQLLEKFAAAPITDFDPPAPSSVSPADTDQPNKQASIRTPPHPAPLSPQLITPPFPGQTDTPATPPGTSSSQQDNEFADDEEAELVNVDEDSDVDILEASSPTPPPQNPYSAYTTAEDTEQPISTPSTPPLITSHTAESPAPDYERTHSRMSEDPPQWTGYDPTQPTTGVAPPVWDDGSSQSGGYTMPANEGELPFTKKEKHKKEKKEKKDKKKKKHKEKDKEKGEGKHKHKKDKSHTAASVMSEDHDDTSQHSQDIMVPRLTLKLGAQAMQDSYNQDPLDLDSSYNTTEDVTEEPQHLPKLVIKPFSGGADGYDSYQEDPAADAPQTYMPVVPDPYAADAGGASQIPIFEEDGKIWICPACQKPDDGSPMIGCDGCDEWYHWPCVGIVQQPPDDVEWFCAACAKKDKKKKKKRKKEKS